MPTFDTDTAESGLCDKIANDFRDELLDLWNDGATSQKEVTQAYSYKDGNKHTSSVREGNPESIHTDMMYESFGELPNFPDEMVVVHTHPASDGYMNTMLSFGDLRNFVRIAEQVNGFAGFYALTETGNNIILFGAEPTPTDEDLEPKQKEIESIMRNMDALQDQGFTKARLLQQVHDIAGEMSSPCATTVRESSIE